MMFMSRRAFCRSIETRMRTFVGIKTDRGPILPWQQRSKVTEAIGTILVSIYIFIIGKTKQIVVA